MRFPDLTGTWFTSSKSETFKTEYKTIIEIDHRFDRFIYSSFRLKRDGKQFSKVSKESGLYCGLDRRPGDNKVRLYVIYQNEVREGEEYSSDHVGCRILTLENEERENINWLLEGNYWTNKKWEPIFASGIGGTRGRCNMEWKRSDKPSEKDHDVVALFAE